MSIKDYKDYLTETYGIVPEHGMTDRDSFNNIVYHAHMLFGRALNLKLTGEDINLVRHHMELQEDENGLYKPKNSKDNLIAKTAVCYKFALPELRRMSLWRMVASSWLNPWDAAFYMFCCGNRAIRALAYPLIPFLYLQMWVAILKKHKVRPTPWDALKMRLKGHTVVYRYFVNDGKHLALLKAFALKHKFPRLTEITRQMYLKRYNGARDYQYVIFYNLYRDKNHPTIAEFKLAANLNRELLA